MTYEHLTDTCLAETIGEYGLDADALALNLAAAEASVTHLGAAAREGRLPFLTVPNRRDDLDACAEAAGMFGEHCAEVLVLGTGGSSLGGQSLYALVERGAGPPPGAPRLTFLDNVDPDSFDVLLRRLDFERTGILAISKSGGTAETLAQLLVLLPRLEVAVGREEVARRLVVITEPRESPLGALADAYGCTRLPHDLDLGGRFSVFSAVGAVPALLAGLDPAALRAGAAEVLEATLGGAEAARMAPAVGAAVSVGLLRERAVTQSVLMTYADRLAMFGQWYRQLWAESLGKDGHGTTPVVARGATDQHSQLQLYLAGPRDKLFTIVSLDTSAAGPRVDPAPVADGPLSYLGGRTLGDLLDAMARATADTLVRNGRPVRRIRLRALDEKVLGALMMHFMLETVIAADLLDVNAFDQPAVEEGKRLARSYLQSAGGAKDAAS